MKKLITDNLSDLIKSQSSRINFFLGYIVLLGLGFVLGNLLLDRLMKGSSSWLFNGLSRNQLHQGFLNSIWVPILVTILCLFCFLWMLKFSKFLWQSESVTSNKLKFFLTTLTMGFLASIVVKSAYITATWVIIIIFTS